MPIRLLDHTILPLIPVYLAAVASTVMFEVDAKTIVAIAALVLTQMWMGIKRSTS